MAALQHESTLGGDKEGATSNINEESIDYVELVRLSLKQQKLMYIADIIEKEEDVSLHDLLEWKRDDIIELLLEIHNNKGNQHQIRVSHRNKFAKAVITISKRKKTALTNNNDAPTPTVPMKLLFLGKEEEEAIDAIQNGHQYMHQSLNKMQQLLSALHKNTENIKDNIHSLCNDIKKQIDEKEKELNRILDNIQNYKLKRLKEQTDAVQTAVNAVDEYYNEYEGYFKDASMTKQDRKNKLLSAKQVIDHETKKMKMQKDDQYDMSIALDKERITDAIRHCFALNDVGLNYLPSAIRLYLKIVLHPEHVDT